MHKKKKKASITITTSLMLLMITSLLLTFLESARVYGLQSYAKMTSNLVMESAFAEYNKELFKRYDLMYLDLAYGEKEMDISKLQGTLLESNKENLYSKDISFFQKNTNLFHMQSTDNEVTSYELATDYNGKAFYEQVVSVMKQKLPYAAASELKDELNQIKDASKNQDNPDQKMQEAQKQITDARNNRQIKAQEEKKPVEISEEEKKAENPLDFVVSLKSKGILGLVLDDSQTISQKVIDKNDDLQTRTYESGTMQNSNKTGIDDRILYQLYLNQYFNTFRNHINDSALDYEQEYILCGNDSDQKNLEGVVDRLLLIREATNFAYLLTDAVKTQEALELATVFVGFTGNPIIVMAVQTGILAAWAFVESVIDVRMLLSGEKIMPIKTAQTWNTDILHISSSFEASKNKKSTQGLSYEAYLQTMIALCSEDTLAMKSMNLIEKNIRAVSKNQNFQMNHMLQRSKVTFIYEANPLFSNVFAWTRNKLDSYSFTLSKEFSYLPSQ